jgi:hypothetical protein
MSKARTTGFVSKAASMRYFIHIVTDEERVLDPDGAEFPGFDSAKAEACQGARDLMAEELRCGRPVPFGWRAQVCGEDGEVLFTIPFAHLVFADELAERAARAPRARTQESDLMLIERAKATFARARKGHAEIRTGLAELRSQVQQLARINDALGRNGI